MSDKLTEKDYQVLEKVAEQEPCRASTIKDVLHWADDIHKVNYRLEKLEDGGYIRRDTVTDESLPINPKEASLVQKGHDALADLTAGDERPKTLEERVEWQEKQVSQAMETYGEVKHRIVGLERNVDSLEEDIDQLDAELDEVVLKLERLLEAFDVLEQQDES